MRTGEKLERSTSAARFVNAPMARARRAGARAVRFLSVLSLALLPASFTSACGPGGAGDGPVELKFGHVGAPGSLYQVAADEFARRVNERLDGRARVVVFGSSQLGGDEVLLQKIKLGTVDMALPSTVMSSYVDAFGLFEMPYLVSDREHMGRIEREIVWPELVPRALESGYRVIAVWENGFRHVTNNVRSIVTPEDLQGIKLRTPRGRWRVRMFQVFGANPTPMAFSEVFVALQTGVMDGQENPFTQIYSARLHEVQDYLSLTRHVYTPAYVTVGPDRWSRLPPDVRDAVESTAREVQEFVYTRAAEMEADLLQKIRAAGVEVNEVDREAFVEASEAVYEEFAGSVPGGGEMAGRALELATDPAVGSGLEARSGPQVDEGLQVGSEPRPDAMPPAGSVSSGA